MNKPTTLSERILNNTVIAVRGEPGPGLCTLEVGHYEKLPTAMTVTRAELHAIKLAIEAVERLDAKHEQARIEAIVGRAARG